MLFWCGVSFGCCRLDFYITKMIFNLNGDVYKYGSFRSQILINSHVVLNLNLILFPHTELSKTFSVTSGYIAVFRKIEPQCCFRTGPTQIELYKHRRWLEDGNFGFKKKRNCTIRVAKTKALISFTVTKISFTVTTNLICVFVFAYANCWFSQAIGV